VHEDTFDDALHAEALFPQLAEVVLRNIATEYPNHLQHLLIDAQDIATPHTLHPSFYGCFDWHSAVHSHWTLIRLLRAWPGIPQRVRIERTLDVAFAPDKLATEAAYLANSARRSFERPYGLAWALQLAGELEVCGHDRGAEWRAAVHPLESVAAQNLLAWLETLRYPVRTGTHQQTAFAWILMLNWAIACNRLDVRERVGSAASRCFGSDTRAPLEYEPSGEDFLSPCLMEADLMSRVLGPAAFATWLERFLPQIPTKPSDAWLDPACVTDESDGRAVHLHGLNLSRAWNLARLARALPERDRRIDALQAAADRHARAGLDAVRRAAHYASTHWLPSFAVYLMTWRLGERV
jgi:hypothetical protein